MFLKPLDKKSVLPWEAGFRVEKAETSLPGVSVVVPIFNSAAFLEKTLRSLLCNDLNGIEIIVMDGGSTDGTGTILEHYSEYLSTVVSEKDRGQSDAINKGFSRATKPVFYWLNGDDLILPNVLVQVRRAFQANAGADVIVGDAYMVELDLTPIRHFQFSREKLKFSHLLNYAANHLVQPSVFFSKAAWDRCGPVAEDLHYAMDADLFLNMANNYELMHLPVDIAYSVYHEECKTRGNRGESITELSLVQARHGGFDEAKATLNILVEMFNAAEKRLESREAKAQRRVSSDCPKCKLMHQRLKAIESEVDSNKRALLELDMKVTDV